MRSFSNKVIAQWLLIFFQICTGLCCTPMHAIPSDHEIKLFLQLLGMVQAWVAHFVTPLKCTYDTYDWRVTR